MKKMSVRALFLGPKSENQDFFKDMVDFLMDEHVHWRRNFHPEDEDVIKTNERDLENFRATKEKTRETLLELSAQLRESSMPWFSPRYLGHMNADTLMVANLGYMTTILYNPNNVAYEASPATTKMEIDIGRQFAELFSYEHGEAWGHVTTDGTIANYEGLWVARNLKSIPLAIKEVLPELVRGRGKWQLLNLTVDNVLDLVKKVKERKKLADVLRYSARGKGVQCGELGKLLVPQSRHYSWDKAVDVLGIGSEDLVSVRVKDNYRMDVTDLEEKIKELTEKKIPILGVVAVVGTTEEGAVDEVHSIVELRSKCETRGVSFYLHIDAAYGGYTRALFIDNKDRQYMGFDEVNDRLHDDGIIAREVQWPTEDIYKAYEAMSEADSITIDPHKMGYVPYAAGGIVFKDKRVLDLIGYTAPYIGGEKKEEQPSLGNNIMEGSKAGASVAAVWGAHRVVPLNVTGYGRLIGHSIEGAQRFHESLENHRKIRAKGRAFDVRSLTKPDFNIVDFAFNEDGNTDLREMNRLNEKIYNECSYNRKRGRPILAEDFITSRTELRQEVYGDAPKAFIIKFSIPATEFDRVKSVFVLRSCILTPYLARDRDYDAYWKIFMGTMKKILERIVD